MKSLSRLCLATLVSVLYINNGWAASSPCEEKRNDILQQLKYAERYHNQSQIDGLKSALEGVERNCHPAKLRADAEEKVTKLSRKLEDKQQQLNEAQQDLKQATEQNNLKKVKKYQRKVDEKQQEVKHVEQDYLSAKQRLATYRSAN